MKTYLPFAIALIPLVGCASQPMTSQSRVAPQTAGVQVAQADPLMEAKAQSPLASDAAPPKAVQTRKIIYTGEVALVTDDLDKAAVELDAKIKVFSGYISNASRSGTRGEAREASWTVRVPAEKFDSFVAALPSLGELQSSSRKADDVSEEFYDVQARLKNKKLEEVRLIELLQKATGKLTEILSVEKELSRVREEIERIEGRLRFLTNQTDLSTVTITVREVKNFVPEGPPTLATTLGRSLTGSLDTMRSLGVALLVVVVALLPWVLPLGLFVLLLLRFLGKAKR